MTFGAKLRTARLDQRRTLAQVAEKAGMTVQQLSALETSDNDARTSPLRILRIAEYLGLDALRLMKMAKPDDYKAWKRAFASVKCDRAHVEGKS